MSAPFLFDDFFVSPEDPGVEVQIPFKGRLVPIRLKRGLTLAEKENATQAAITRHIDEDTGRVLIDGIDDAKLGSAVVAAYIKEWPFRRADGNPVPATPEFVAQLDSNFSDALMTVIKRLQEGKREEADGPFAPTSGVPSGVAADPNLGTFLPAPSPSDSPVTSSSVGDQSISEG